MRYLRISILLASTLLLFACSSQQVRQCPEGTQELPNCPPEQAINDADINKLYDSRTWLPPRKMSFDPVRASEEAQIPINNARAKVIGPSYEDALKSLAAKIWLIENAEHTVDAMYYIFQRDAVGYAILGALCDAVQRGVDVRLMVDSLGSIHPNHYELQALETCGEKGGFMRNVEGKLTTKKARVQVVIFNAMTYFNFNRRSHDKILVIDGHFPDKSAVMTGGRNISLDYYGINEDGSKDPTAFRDTEILLRGNPAGDEKVSVGSVSELYFSMIYLYKGNRRLIPGWDDDPLSPGLKSEDYFPRELEKSRESLAFIKSLPHVKKHLDEMPGYMSNGFYSSEVRLAHQLGNLTYKDVATNTLDNLFLNPNSILYLIHALSEKRLAESNGKLEGTLRIVSPYLFLGLYYDDDGNVVYDGGKAIHDVLRDNPNMKIEIVTNSVLTSDNFITQGVIDLDMAPRLLLTPELIKTWQSSLKDAEFNPDVVESAEWKKLIDHPQIFIYETGKLDSVELGGTAVYGKLHAKFIRGEEVGFIGTSNFDYRSNLYNNEVGFFYRDPAIRDDLDAIFDELKATSYRWGTPEWLQMRKELYYSDSKKKGNIGSQRGWFKTINALGLEYLM